MEDKKIAPPSFVYAYGLFLITVVIAVVVYLVFQWLLLAGYSLLIMGGVTGFVCLSSYYHKTYHAQKKMITDRRIQMYKLDQAREKARELELKNNVLEQLPNMMKYGIDRGMNVGYMGLAITDWKSNLHTLGSGTKIPEIEGPVVASLPEYIDYDTITLADNEELLGCDEDGPVTIPITPTSNPGNLIWIVGLSGTGKTSTCLLRVERRVTSGHKFLGCDPHYFKPDSLTNSLTGYAEMFLRPMARSEEEIDAVLDEFLGIFESRRRGLIPSSEWFPITIVIDEVNSLMDTTSKEEKALNKKIQRVGRICGQEGRNFLMGGIYISQQATELSWLRKIALLIIVHKLNMLSERKIAVNEDKAVVADMDYWKKGRTYVYGCEVEGGRILQQPYFASKRQGQWLFEEAVKRESEEEKVLRIRAELIAEGKPHGYRDIGILLGCGKDKVGKILSKYHE